VLLVAAAGKTKGQVELLIAERFPKSDVPTSIQPVAPAPPAVALNGDEPCAATTPPPLAAPAPTGSVDDENMQSKLVPEPVPHERTAAVGVPMVPLAPEPRIAPLSPGRYELRLTMPQRMHDKLRYAQELLGHVVPSGDVPEILERALDELIARLERRKFAASDSPRAPRRPKGSRHIPASVRREVWDRDHGRCTFVSHDGQRCESRKFLEYDHEQPVARGGHATVANIRLRCRAHNQLEAERTFGAGFMEEKRNTAKHARRQPGAHLPSSGSSMLHDRGCDDPLDPAMLQVGPELSDDAGGAQAIGHGDLKRAEMLVDSNGHRVAG
jgi:5-methylcytosine-specific restriction endonuclease McrA